jgi:protocatechuate 3,4-dioxygenase beta subunit
MSQRIAPFALFAVIFLSCVLQAQQPSSDSLDKRASPTKTEPAMIAGRVVRATDGAPLNKATVIAMIMQTGQTGPIRPTSVRTNSDGKFLLKDLEPGRYNLSATRSGYARQQYGQRIPSGPGTAITLLAGQELKDIVFRMTPAGVIAGRIVDEDEEPVYQARVQAQRWVYIRGKRQLVGGGFAQTNDLGEYRIAQLAPGRYFVSADYPGEMFAMPGQSPNTHEGYSQTFFPGVYDSAQANPIEVKSGDQIGGINLRLVPTHAVRIRGVVQGAGTKALGVNVELQPKGARFGPFRKASFADEKGAFEFDGVLPGTYILTAMSFEDENRKSARQSIEVADSDVDGVVLALTSSSEIPGRVRLEGNFPMKDVHLRVGLMPEDSPMMFGGRPGLVNDDLTFTLKDYADDDYRLSVWGLPQDTYVKSAYSGDHDVLNETFHLTGAVKPLEIIISANGGRVEGAVTDSKNNPITGARVVIVPEESRRKRQDLFKSSDTDQYGRFSLHGITPGSYTIYAWEQVEQGAYMDPDFLKQYADEGKAIRVSESATITEDLKVIPASAAEAAGN